MAENEHQTGAWVARRMTWGGLGLIAAIVGISSLHYVTAPSRVVLHELYNYLWYVPNHPRGLLVWDLGWPRRRGLTSALFIPHIRAAWAGNAAYSASQYAQVFVFHLLGLTVGWLAGRQRRLTTRYGMR